MTDTTTDTTTDTSTTSTTSSTGGAGSGKTIVVDSDNIEGKSKDKQRINNIVNALKQAGYNAVASGVGPNYHVSDMRDNKNSYIVAIVGGLCAGTIKDYGATYYQNYMKNNNNGGGQAYIWTWGKYKCNLDQITRLERAWDDNFSGSGFTGIDNPAEYMKNTAHMDYCAAGTEDEFVTAVVNMVKTGSGGSGGSSGSTATVVEGFIESGRGESPQYWNVENYEDYVEIPFTNFERTEENPRIQTATFETTERLDVLDGRDAILITGDCNDFGGIILEHEYDSTKKIWKYTCQGFMDRIMANQINRVANGSKTAHELIKETLADMSVPDVNLLDADEYDTAVTEDTQEKMKKDADLVESSDRFGENENTGSSSSSSDDENKNTTTLTKTTSSTEDGDTRNPFKRKPVGLYDKLAISEFIRTLIFDYGINVDFYGDINGVPHFDIIDLETWKKTGWYLAPEMGFEHNYTYSFDLTDIVTQVAVKNVSAINGTGEIYTAEELIGVPIEDFVGRMGVVVDNPSAEGTSSSSSDTTIVEKYQDSSGNQYEATKVLNTNGYPGCNKCSKKNGGTQPTYQTYSKAWLNKCPSCEKEGTLSSSTDNDKDGKTVCSNCKKTYCQYCGFEKKSGNKQLTELFRVQETSGSNTSNSSTDSENSTT